MRRSAAHTETKDQLLLFVPEFSADQSSVADSDKGNTSSLQVPNSKSTTIHSKPMTKDLSNSIIDIADSPATRTDSKKSTRERVTELLSGTHRNGIEQVISNLEREGFYTAPASTVFHGNYRGGLADHSLNVCLTALRLRELMLSLKPELEPLLLRDNVIISALLHDVCKIDIYKEEEKWRKDANNKWETYKTFGVNYSALPLGHGEKSVIRLLQWGLELREDEMIAIRWHMSAWDMPFQSNEFKGNFSAAQEKYPLLAIISAADGLSTSLLDKKV